MLEELCGHFPVLVPGKFDVIFGIEQGDKFWTLSFRRQVCFVLRVAPPWTRNSFTQCKVMQLLASTAVM